MIYCDPSALVKLVVVEPESAALVHRLEGQRIATSALGWTETARAIAVAYPEPTRRAVVLARGVELFDGLYVLAVSDEVLRAAAALELPNLRTLHAIHLASAALVRDEMSAFVTYDARQSVAANALGFPTAAPS